MFTPFKLQENLIFRSPPSKKYIASSSLVFSSVCQTKLRKELASSETILVDATWIIYNSLY